MTCVDLPVRGGKGDFNNNLLVLYLIDTIFLFNFVTQYLYCLCLPLAVTGAPSSCLI